MTDTTDEGKHKNTGGDQRGELKLDALRLSQDFEATLGVKKALLTVPVKKPDKQAFVRVHPDESYRFPTAILEFKEDRESYLVDPALLSEIPGEVVPKMLFTAITRQGVVFLWPVPLPMEDGRVMEWHRSLLQAAEMAMCSWVRVVANMSLGAYEVFEASGDLPEPQWPDVDFQGLLNIAFRDQFIGDISHPAIQRLRGAL
jgi:hypothetical protein